MLVFIAGAVYREGRCWLYFLLYKLRQAVLSYYYCCCRRRRHC